MQIDAQKSSGVETKKKRKRPSTVIYIELQNKLAINPFLTLKSIKSMKISNEP